MLSYFSHIKVKVFYPLNRYLSHHSNVLNHRVTWADKSTYSSLSHMARLQPATACPSAQTLPVAGRPPPQWQAASRPHMRLLITAAGPHARACPSARPLLPAVNPVLSRGPRREHRRSNELLPTTTRRTSASRCARSSTSRPGSAATRSAPR